MDLVEIRKKAKNKKNKPDAETVPVSDETNSTGQLKEPSDDVKADPESESEPDSVEEHDKSTSTGQVESSRGKSEIDETETSLTARDTDPIDALFSFQAEGKVATVEAYLQTLMENEEVIDADVEQWLTFSLGEEEYALSIESVSEIIKPREVTDIPRVPGFIRGIISLRGIIVPIFDLNKRLSLGTAELGASARIIVCQDGDRMAGFIVDRINQVVNVPLKNIEPPPTVLSGLDRDFVEGVGRVDDRMLILLDLSNVINAELV